MKYRVLVSDRTQRTSIHAADCEVVNRQRDAIHWHDLPEAATATEARDRFEAENEIIARGWPRTSVCQCATDRENVTP